MGRNSQTANLSVSVDTLDVDVEFADVAMCECGAEVEYEVDQENSQGVVEISLTRHCCSLGEALNDLDDEQVVTLIKNSLPKVRRERLIEALASDEHKLLVATLRGIAEAANGCLPRQD